MDSLSKSARSENMSRIGSKDTAIELVVRSELHSRGLRYSLHRPDLPGRPDIVFRKARVAVFVNGCFWHHHSCQRGSIPRTHVRFWRGKLTANKKRDLRNYRLLRAAGWHIIIIWQCRLGSTDRIGKECTRIGRALRNARMRSCRN